MTLIDLVADRRYMRSWELIRLVRRILWVTTVLLVIVGYLCRLSRFESVFLPTRVFLARCGLRVRRVTILLKVPMHLRVCCTRMVLSM